MWLILVVSNIGSSGWKEGRDLFYGKGIFDAEDTACRALQAVQMGSASERLSQIAGKGTHVSSFAAGNSDCCARQPEGSIVSDIDS